MYIQQVINMAEKKETVKEATKVVKKPTKVVKRAQSAKKPEKIEQQFFAKDLADQMGISSIDFLLIKRENNIKDDTPLTASEMKKIFYKTVEGR